MATYNLSDYRSKYFEHKDLDKVYSQPDHQHYYQTPKAEQAKCTKRTNDFRGG